MRKKHLLWVARPLLLLCALGCATTDAAITDEWVRTDNPCELLEEGCLDAAPQEPTQAESVLVVPGTSLPREIEVQPANNNLDIAWFNGRLYLAFRTAPTHFADKKVELFVMSTADQKSWEFESRVSLQTDIREPRFMVVGDRLLLYFAVLGDLPFTFDPMGTYVIAFESDAQWSEPLLLDSLPVTFIPWRAKTRNGTTYLIGYDGGESIYQSEGRRPIEVHWFKTQDGLTFEPAAGGSSTVLRGGSSETGFDFLSDGRLFAVSRNEGGFDDSWGSKVCRAEPDNLGEWTCRDDPRKFDSPAMFESGGRMWLLARRNVTDTGHYDLMRRDLEPDDQTAEYITAYWVKPKRCALWEVNPKTLAVDHVFDLPTNGDTCFASVLTVGAHQHLVYDYTSPLDEPDLAWNKAQNRPTSIYRTVLSLPAR